MKQSKTMVLEIEFEIRDKGDMQYITKNVMDSIVRRKGSLLRMETRQKERYMILPTMQQERNQPNEMVTIVIKERPCDVMVSSLRNLIEHVRTRFLDYFYEKTERVAR